MQVRGTCGQGGGDTLAPAVTLKGNQGHGVGGVLLKALQLKPQVPWSQPHLLPNKGGEAQVQFIRPSTQAPGTSPVPRPEALGRRSVCLRGLRGGPGPQHVPAASPASAPPPTGWAPALGASVRQQPRGGPAGLPDPCPPGPRWGLHARLRSEEGGETGPLSIERAGAGFPVASLLNLPIFLEQQGGPRQSLS